MLKLIHEDVILCYCPYLRILKLHVDTKVDEQTMLFFYIEPFLPEDKVTEKCILFFVILPIWRNANYFFFGEDWEKTKNIYDVLTCWVNTTVSNKASGFAKKHRCDVFFLLFSTGAVSVKSFV